MKAAILCCNSSDPKLTRQVTCLFLCRGYPRIQGGVSGCNCHTSFLAYYCEKNPCFSGNSILNKGFVNKGFVIKFFFQNALNKNKKQENKGGGVNLEKFLSPLKKMQAPQVDYRMKLKTKIRYLIFCCYHKHRLFYLMKI